MTTSEDMHNTNIGFRIMAAYLKFRERFRKPKELLLRIGLSLGETILDYGCGIGSYTIPAAELVGENGMVYALDVHPLAVQRVAERAEKAELPNIETIQSNIQTGLDDKSVDHVFLFDVFHWVKDKKGLLLEFDRIMKDTGTLSVIIDHIDPLDFVEYVWDCGLFTISDQEDNFFILKKIT